MKNVGQIIKDRAVYISSKKVFDYFKRTIEISLPKTKISKKHIDDIYSLEMCSTKKFPENETAYILYGKESSIVIMPDENIIITRFSYGDFKDIIKFPKNTKEYFDCLRKLCKALYNQQKKAAAIENLQKTLNSL